MEVLNSQVKLSLKIKTIQEKTIPILKKYGITKASIFGSYARAEETESSDIDILVELPDSLGLLDIIRIINELEDTIHKKIDLVEYKSIHPILKDSILKEQVLIYG